MAWYLFLVCTATLVCVGAFVKTLRRWFLAFGCVGVLVALALFLTATWYKIPPKILLVLWPPALAGFADPTTLQGKIIVGMIEFGGNFVLYAAVGTLVGLGFRRKPSQSPFTTQ